MADGHGFFARSRFGSSEVTAPLRTWSTLIKEERPIGRLQRQGLVRKDESHPMHRVAKESELIESGDGSMARGTAVEFGHDSRHGGLTESAFSWKALTCSDTVCSCGADHAALLREALSYQRASHPWEVEYQEWRRNLGEFLLSEEIYQRELSRLD